MLSLNDLVTAFSGNMLFAWEILYAQMQLESGLVSTDYLKQLVLLYSTGLEKMNHLQKGNQNYFKGKINQLMGQKKVIQCLRQENISRNNNKLEGKKENTNQILNQLTLNNVKRDSTLQARKRQLQMHLAYHIQDSKTNKLSKMIKEESIKSQKLTNFVQKWINSEEQKLNLKIAKRQAKADKMRSSLKMSKLDMSGISTYGQVNDQQTISMSDSIFDDLSFINNLNLNLQVNRLDQSV